MWRPLLILFLLPVALALAARWWFGLRVLAAEGRTACRFDLSRWKSISGEDRIENPAANRAAELGGTLRLAALEDWRQRQPGKHRSREGARRFGLAVPPLSAIIAVFALIVAKVPVTGAIAIVLAATALAALIGLMSLPGELQAITLLARRIRESRAFPSRDEEDAVVACAIARAWMETFPPVLKLIQK